MKKLTLKQAKDEYNKYGFILLEDEWGSAEKPHKCMDSDGYLYNKTLSNIRQIGTYNKSSFNKPFDTRNKYYWENVLHYMENLNEVKLLSKKEDFTSSSCKLKFQCPICGKIFYRTWKSFIELSNKVCTDCYKKTISQAEHTEKRRNSMDKYISKADELGLKILDGHIDNCKSKINVEDKEGYRGVIFASRLLTGSTFEKWSTYRNPYIQYNLQKLIYNNGFKSVVLSVEKDFVLIQCECGEIFRVSKDHLVYGCQYVCKKCRKSMSLLEQRVKMWLDENNISYTEQQTFDGLCGVGGKKLRFDFYIMDKNICIEVDGEQHYKENSFCNDKNSFAVAKEHDCRKDKYCQVNNITLIRIPYWDITKSDKYKYILTKFLLD